MSASEPLLGQADAASASPSTVDEAALSARLDALAAQLAGTLDLLGQLVDGWGAALSARLDRLDRLDALEKAQAHAIAQLDGLEARAEAHARLVEQARDDVPALAARLAEVRETDAYRAALAEPEPLVTVRIATYNRPAELVDVAIASVLRQSYQNFEIVVVSDGPSDANRAAVEAVGDRRIRYVELAEKTPYPSRTRNRYLISGASGMNRGSEEARGAWIAPLDDDDAFSPDHLEVLLGHARASGAELVYGAFTQRVLDAEGRLQGLSRIYSDPPISGGFTFQAAMYLAELRFFRFDEQSWLFDQPGDWHLMSRMMRAGVRVSGIRREVSTLNSVPYWMKQG